MVNRPTFLSGYGNTEHSPTEHGKGGSRVHFDPEEIGGHIEHMSYPSKWEKSYLCPCRTVRTRQPDPMCPRCRGRAIAYLPATGLHVVYQSQERGTYNSELGTLDTGTAIGSIEVNQRVSFRDRLTLEGTKVRQSTLFDVTAHRVKYGHFLVYDVHDIEFITIVDRTLSEGDDYTFDRGTNIFYPGEHLLGENISMNITTTLRYVVADLLKEHRYARLKEGGFTPTAQKVLLRREDLFVEREPFSIGIDEREEKEIIDPKEGTKVIQGINGFFTK